MKFSAIDKLANENLNIKAFEGEVVVFTGKLSSMTRGEAMAIIRRLGGRTASSVTKSTTCLITNSKDLEDLIFGKVSTKFKKVVALKENGYPITILNEEEFFRIIIR